MRQIATGAGVDRRQTKTADDEQLNAAEHTEDSWAAIHRRALTRDR
jgi:hypothetical protein